MTVSILSAFKGCFKVVYGKPTKTGKDGPGVKADYSLYVSAKTTSSCSENVIAYAAYCQLERALDRYALRDM